MKTKNQVALIAASIALDHYQKGLVKQIYPDMEWSEACVKVAEDLVIHLAHYTEDGDPWGPFVVTWGCRTKKEALSKWLLSRIGIEQ